MSSRSVPAISEVQPVGFEAKLARLAAVERRLSLESAALDAAAREYDEHREAYNVALAEHDALRRALFTEEDE